MKLLGVGTAAMCASALTGCASSDDVTWTAIYDESLGLLAAGPNEDVIMGNAWMFRDNGTVQLQFAAGSIPVPAVESACTSLFSRRRKALTRAPSNPSRSSSMAKNTQQSGPKTSSSKPVHSNVGSVRLIQPRTRIRQRKTQVRASLPGIRALEHMLPCFGESP